MGCPVGKTCTIDKGCILIADIGINASVNNMDNPTIDCIDTGSPQLPKYVSLDIELVNISSGESIIPHAPASDNLVELGDDVYIGSKSVDGMYGSCERVHVNDWSCEIEIEDFNPFCWTAESATETVLTEISWTNQEGDNIKIDLTDDVTFTVDPANDRP